MKRDPRSRVNVELDIEGYKKRKVKDIIRQAKTIAQKVKKSGKSEELSPMKASKRKKIHKAITGIDGIDTVSVGEGSSRRVKITKT
jgi:spoIIIJ-associated protein